MEALILSGEGGIKNKVSLLTKTWRKLTGKSSILKTDTIGTLCEHGGDAQVEGVSIGSSVILNYPTFVSLRKAFTVDDDNVLDGGAFFRKQQAQHLIKIAEGNSTFDDDVTNMNTTMHYATVMLGAIILHVMQRDLPQPEGDEVHIALLKRLLPVDMEPENSNLVVNSEDMNVRSIPSPPFLLHGPTSRTSSSCTDASQAHIPTSGSNVGSVQSSLCLSPIATPAPRLVDDTEASPACLPCSGGRSKRVAIFY